MSRALSGQSGSVAARRAGLVRLRREPRDERLRTRKWSDKVWIFIFLIPFLVLYGGFTAWPLIATIMYSLFDWAGYGPLTDFVGLGNYREIAQDPLFWSAFRNTIIFTVVETCIKLPVSFFLAVLLTRRWMWFKRVWRTIFFIPLLMPTPLLGLIMPYILDPTHGAFNEVLRKLGIIGADDHVSLLTNGTSALMVIIVMSSWQVIGQYMIYWLAALQNVPEELYEAAEIDGCGPWQKQRYITLPLIKPIAVIITLLGLVHALHVFGIVVTLTGGGPGQSTYTVSYFIYVMAFQNLPFRYGYSSAAALLFALLALIFVTGQGVLAQRAQRLRKEYGV